MKVYFKLKLIWEYFKEKHYLEEGWDFIPFVNYGEN
ncbi:MAG: hypothetical protein ACJAY8_000529 [Sphingobacteriales bacterium]|jgi:hypothetical protein